MTGVAHHKVGASEADERLDRWLKRRFPALAFGRLQKLLRTGQVRVDGKRAKGDRRLKEGEEIRLPPMDDSPAPAHDDPFISKTDAKELRARVLFKDGSVLALDKPAGLAVQGGTGQHRSLDDMLPALVAEGAERPRLVHRLDQDTSGVLLLALTQSAARELTFAFKGRQARKLYWALVAGVPEKRSGRIDLPLAKLPGKGGERMAIDKEEGLSALTLYATIAVKGKKVAWLALSPQTGRTHQLRAHLAAIGRPILGDGKYGGKAAFLAAPALPRQLMLHAREIAVPHPEDQTTLRVTAPLPAHLQEAFHALGFNEADGIKVDQRMDELGA